MKEKLASKFAYCFEPQIKYRGEAYYDKNKVETVYKCGNHYKGVVWGTEYGVSYDVNIIVTENDIDMECSCPYDDDCKHEYATLLAIDANEFINIEFRPVEDTKIDFDDLIQKIPEEELKQYLLRLNTGNNSIYKRDLMYRFAAYLPEKKKEYFYNTLCNEIQLAAFDEYGDSEALEELQERIKEFVNLSQKVLEKENYNYSFLIVSTLIEAMKEETSTIEKDYLFEEYEKIGKLIRIAFRKGDSDLKNEIKKWIKKIKKLNYYRDIYLEDMIAMIME